MRWVLRTCCRTRTPARTHERALKRHPREAPFLIGRHLTGELNAYEPIPALSCGCGRMG